MSGSQQVYSAASSSSAHIMSNRLRDCGIDAVVVGDAMESLYGIARHVSVCVAENDVEAARNLIEQWESEKEESALEEPLPTQFGLRLIFVNITLLAIVFAVAGVAWKAGSLTIVVASLFYLVLGNLMAIAYYRKTKRRYIGEDESSRPTV